MYYTVKNNDTLQRISAKFYADWTLYKLISDVNGISDVLPGMKLFIPNPITEDFEHTIVLGDSYESLSFQYYGTEHFSGLIFSENDGLVLEENLGRSVLIPLLISERRLNSL